MYLHHFEFEDGSVVTIKSRHDEEPRITLIMEMMLHGYDYLHTTVGE